MKLESAITEGAPGELIEAFGSSTFAAMFLNDVVTKVFGVDNPFERPAEYLVQKPDVTVPVIGGCWGVEVRLTGVSRNGRPAKVFQRP